jgi:hypothetical protein
MFSLYSDLARQHTALLLEEAETERLVRQARTARRRRRAVRRSSRAVPTLAGAKPTHLRTQPIPSDY